jgi:hypothetical protein
LIIGRRLAVRSKGSPLQLPLMRLHGDEPTSEQAGTVTSEAERRHGSKPTIVTQLINRLSYVASARSFI